VTVLTPAPYVTGGTYTAKADRTVIQAWARSQGVNSSVDLKVTQSGTPGMSVVVAPGFGLVTPGNSQGGLYVFYNDAPVTKAVPTPDTTNTRWDYVIANVYDTDVAGASIVSSIEYVAGIASPTPAPPSLTAYQSYIILAKIVVGPNVGSIVDANISDMRTKTNVPDASVPALSAIANPKEGQLAYDTSVHKLYVYDNTLTPQLVWPLTAGAITTSMIADYAITPSKMNTTSGSFTINITGSAGTAAYATDAGTLGTRPSDASATASTIVLRDGSGNVNATGLIGTSGSLNSTQAGANLYMFQNSLNGALKNFIEGYLFNVLTGNYEIQWKINQYGTLSVPSDESRKDNVVDADNAALAAAIDGIKLRKFNYKGTNDIQLGVIAQEIETVLPEAVEDLGDVKGVNINPVVWALVAKVQELEERLAAIEKK
jgi:hypothetical protein